MKDDRADECEGEGRNRDGVAGLLRARYVRDLEGVGGVACGERLYDEVAPQ